MSTEQQSEAPSEGDGGGVATGTDTLTVTDNRTGRTYELPIEDDTIKALDLRQIKVHEDDFGMMAFDPAFTNTASCRSSITYIDGEAGILEHRGIPIEQLCEHSTYLEVAYLLVFGELPTRPQLEAWVHDVTHHTFVHEDIAKAEPVANESAIGWIFHYAVGILFAATLLAIWGLGWARSPTFLPALIVGLVTVGCGWFILQPGMGAGIAASRRPNATTIRVLNIVGHVVFAIGLYGTALLIR